MYEKDFLKKLVCKLIAHIFTLLLLATFVFKSVNYSRHSEILNLIRNFKTAIWPFPNIFQRLTVTPKIDQFGRKRYQSKRKYLSYQLLEESFQKYFVVHEQSAVKNLFSTYVCYDPDGLFWLNLYIYIALIGLLIYRKVRNKSLGLYFFFVIFSAAYIRGRLILSVGISYFF